MTADGTRGVFGGWTDLVTARGDRITLAVKHPTLSLVVARDAGRAERIDLAYPGLGYGGHEFVLSSQESYLLMWLYSGQNEVGYELFSYSPELRHLESEPYRSGDGFVPTFSDDEKWLAQSWTVNSGLYVHDESLLDESDLTKEACVLEWASVSLRELATGRVQSTRIDVCIPAGFPYEGDDSWYASQVQFDADGSLRVEAEWGQSARLHQPLPAAQLIDGPQARGA